MAEYEYGRIRLLATKLGEAGIPQETADAILEGGESIRSSTSSEKKTEWIRQAMNKMDKLLDEPTRHTVRERCACCLSGKRLEISKSIARNHESLEERIRAANDARFVFGHSVTLQEDGRILVSFWPEGQEHYKCVCLPQAREPLSITYCYCCGGHVKHHLQIALGQKLSCEVRSSALESGGKRPCTFLFAIQ